MKSLLATSVLALSMISCHSFSMSAQNNFDDKEHHRGWHWYDDDDEPVIKEKKNPAPPPPPPATKPQVTIDVKWLRDNLPKLLDKAQDNPTKANIAAYYYAQRIAADKASGFAKGTKEFFMFESELQENNRRPTEKNTIIKHKDITSINEDRALKSIFNKAGLWMFYASNCGYCHKQFPMLEMLVKLKKVNVLAISINGISLEKNFPGIPHVIDHNQNVSKKFNITVTPTILLVTNDGANFHMISQGLMSGSAVIERVLVAGRELNLITDDEYTEAREVRNYSTTNAPIQADKEKLEQDPEYLAELLRQRLKGIKPSTTTRIKERKKNEKN